MERQIKRISFEEFADNLAEVIDEVSRENETFVVETKFGEIEVKRVSPTELRQREKTQEDKDAFLASAGAWADVDVDGFLSGNRPPFFARSS